MNVDWASFKFLDLDVDDEAEFLLPGHYFYSQNVGCGPEGGKQEHHVHFEGSADNRRAYKESTGRDMWDDVAAFLKEHFHIDHCNFAYAQEYRPETKYVYFWACVKDMPPIMEALNTQFPAHWLPKLTVCIRAQLKRDQRYFADALCWYQERFGAAATRKTLHVYFRDIDSSS